MGGQLSPAQVGAKLAATERYGPLGAQMIAQQTAPRNPPTSQVIEMSVGQNKEGKPLFNKFILSPNGGQLIPLGGEAYTKGATTEVNINKGDARNFDPKSRILKLEGQAALDAGLPDPTTIVLDDENNIKQVIRPTALGEKNTQTQENIGRIFGDMENMLFGESGIYTDYGAWSEKLSEITGMDINSEGLLSKLTQTARSNLEQFLQSDPRFKAYNDYVKLNLVPIVRAQGEVGNLNEDERKDAKDALISITGWNIDTPPTARIKMDQLWGLIKLSKERNRKKWPNAPEIGAEVHGHIYLGGDPTADRNWKWKGAQ